MKTLHGWLVWPTGKIRPCDGQYRVGDFDLDRYTYAAVFATQIVAAASFAQYWGLAQVYRTVFFYFVAPFSILFINFAGVFVRHPILDSLQIALWLKAPVLWLD